MKDQYFGDINDYRKYGLLRAIIRASPLRWMAGATLNNQAHGAFADGPVRYFV